ncbi:hypothetical protein JG687_00004322 [Phytophthora cactorum]|uniref:Uncharacterized protein n=1 Tax=Phytophthora cactorum TaxID=29920 RepID=A0A329SUI3_9STRA|nr:hypothetical protein Pcac1_g17243 [Phytophthora cactorum]KAG2832186.1 hypothetical protein PC112_g7001 [Phytophthora cactorum]KAG2861477.1 hypothetical protein PC113_g7126 [Phytophthora cactorum]KAG2918890.1 hypothetical protein PC114_g6659 [Phytophthora cactorum]KAG2931542.1 hypothetical protein PC115_g6059 [Phytophthora cactorum]
MTEAALAGPTVSLMTRRRASAPPAQPADAVAASSSEAKQRSKSSGSAANSENFSEDSNAARSGEAKAEDSTPAIHQNHPENLCRYPNKRCYCKRAVKNNGDLHKFCDKHRDSANRYQRKLEQKLKEKRMQSRMRALQVQQAQAQAQAQVQTQMVHVQAHTHTSFNVVDPAVINNFMVSPYPGVEMYGAVPNVASGEIAPVSSTVVPFPGHSAVVVPLSSRTGDWTQGEDEYEPYQHPVQLQSEDLDCLDLLFEH